jgi:hypothetical protein
MPRCARISSLAWKLLHTHHHDLPPLVAVPTTAQLCGLFSDDCYHGRQPCSIFRRHSRPFRITSCPPTTRMLMQRLLPLVRSPRKTATMLMLRSSRRSGVAPHASPRPHTAGRGADFCSTTHPREISPLHWPGAGPTRAAVRAGRCAPNTTTSPTRLSPPPPCAGRRSGRPGAAASRQGAPLHFHRLSAVLLRAVTRAGAVPRAPITGGVPSSAGPAPCLREPSSVQARGHCALTTIPTPTVTSAVVRRPRK